MNILVDMNLSPDWIFVLQRSGHTAMHWSNVGTPSASDREILEWARLNGYIVFTHDLDFGSILAATATDSPSVIQIRSQDITPHSASGLLLETLAKFSDQLRQGALVSVDEQRARVRIFPLKE